VRNRLERGEDPAPRRQARDQSDLDPAAALRRLKQDPSLRFSESGRILLRLLEIHALGPEEWERMIANVPPHCSGILADLGRESAQLWSDFAARMKCDRSATNDPASAVRASR
jgi:hypothetical protein